MEATPAALDREEIETAVDLLRSAPIVQIVRTLRVLRKLSHEHGACLERGPIHLTRSTYIRIHWC